MTTTLDDPFVVISGLPMRADLPGTRDPRHRPSLGVTRACATPSDPRRRASPWALMPRCRLRPLPWGRPFEGPRCFDRVGVSGGVYRPVVGIRRPCLSTRLRWTRGVSGERWGKRRRVSSWNACRGSILGVARERTKPPCIKLSCIAWAPWASRRVLRALRRRCAAWLRPHLLTRWVAHALPRDFGSCGKVRQRMHAFWRCRSGGVADAASSHMVFDACWSALIAGSVARPSVAGAFRARTRAMHPRSVAVPRVHGVESQERGSPGTSPEMRARGSDLHEHRRHGTLSIVFVAKIGPVGASCRPNPSHALPCRGAERPCDPRCGLRDAAGRSSQIDPLRMPSHTSFPSRACRGVCMCAEDKQAVWGKVGTWHHICVASEADSCRSNERRTWRGPILPKMDPVAGLRAMFVQP